MISTEKESENGFLAKINSKGDLLWMKQYGGRKDDILHTIKKDLKNNLILFGYSNSNGAKNNNPWIIKVNMKGDEIWEYSYGSHNEERIVAGAVLRDNSYIMAGYVSKREIEKQDYNFDALLLKVDETGNLIWLKTFGGKENEETGQSIVSYGDKFFITGRTYSTNNK